MPYTVGKQGSRYAIRKKLGNGRTTTVGHSTTKAKAQASVRARNAAAHGARMNRGGRARSR